jgi:hypothetical protein
MMDPRERHRPDETRHSGDAGGTGSSNPHDDARAAGERFLAAGEEAIRRALSRDSRAFLRANRQRGGE